MKTELHKYSRKISVLALIPMISTIFVPDLGLVIYLLHAAFVQNDLFWPHSETKAVQIYPPVSPGLPAEEVTTHSTFPWGGLLLPLLWGCPNRFADWKLFAEFFI